MRSKLFKAAVCACAVIIQAFALSGCSNNANVPYETSSDSSSVESAGEFSSEDSAASSEQSTVSSDASSSKSVPWDTNEQYPEVVLDQQILDNIEEDSLDVTVQLYMDDKDIRAEYNEKFPDLVEDNYAWFRFLCNKSEQLIKDFMPDYGLNYEEISCSLSSAYFRWDLDKGTINSMLDDTRVRVIIYHPNGTPLDHLTEC